MRTAPRAGGHLAGLRTNDCHAESRCDGLFDEQAARSACRSEHEELARCHPVSEYAAT